MLLTTSAAISGVAAKKNVGTVVYGGNVPAGDRVTTFPGTGLLGTQNPSQYISAAAGSGLYLGSGTVGGTLAQNDRDDAIIYYSQKADLAGVASTAVGKPVAGPFDMPHATLSGSYVSYAAGWNWATGQPISAPTVGGETYGTFDEGASGVGEYVVGYGNLNPTSGDYPTRV